jgi:NitT/TauT family transport system ATP-binding protein
MSFLTVDRVSKAYSGSSAATLALAEVSLRIEKGELLVILGPSGCGKTTLLQILAGLEEASQGSVLLDGQPVHGPGAERTLVFQAYNLFPWLTALENVAFGLRLRAVEPKTRDQEARRILGWMGLSAHERLYPHQLSGGMQQRVAIARALAVHPKVLLLDEPFASVDALTRAQLQDELLRLWSERGQTVVFVTHNIREALLLADQIALLTPGPGRVRSCFPVDIPRPRRQHLADLIRWEAQLEEDMATGADRPDGKHIL